MMVDSRNTDFSDAEAGFALVAVLIFILVTSVVIGRFATEAVLARKLSSHQLRAAQAQIAATNIASVYAHIPSGDFAGNRSSCSLNDWQLEISRQDHSGLIDLNAAPKRQLLVGLAALGVSAESAERIADQIVGYRSNRTLSNPDAITGGYKSLPFESVHELGDFQDLGLFTSRELMGVFTVHSARGRVDERTKSPRLRDSDRVVRSLPPPDGANGGVTPRALSLTVLLSNGDFRHQRVLLFVRDLSGTQGAFRLVTNLQLLDDRGTFTPPTGDCAEVIHPIVNDLLQGLRA